MSLLLAAGTIGCWWFLSDYFMAGFPLWNGFWDAFLFIPASALLLAAIVGLGVRRIARGATPPNPHPPPLPSQFAMEVGSCINALLELRSRAAARESAHDSTLTVRLLRLFDPCARINPTHYFAWLAERLHALPPHVQVSASHVARCWWPARRTIWRVWIRILWVPLLWGTLYFLPHYTNVTELLAVRFHSAPAEIFDVIVRGRMPMRPGTSVPPMLSESLPRRRDAYRGTSWRQATTSQIRNGFIDVHATHHPRVYRRIRIVCGGVQPACIVGRDPDHLGLEVVVPVHPGPLSLDFIQRIFDPGLDMHLQLLRWDGAVIDEGTIRPDTGKMP